MANRYYPTFFDLLGGYVDPRTTGRPLMASPLPTISICILYFVGVKLGQLWMKGRRPYDLKPLVLLYNAIQLSFSLWLFFQSGLGGWFGEYNWICQPLDFSSNPTSLRMGNASWWFFFSKFTEFMDTVFLILRKKTAALSSLHIIHHGIMPFCAWLMATGSPVGHGSLTVLINPLVHFFMYSYYFLSALGPSYAGWIWWKNYLTTLQMVQFVMTFVHSMILVVSECNYPVHSAYVVIFLSILFFTLFADFSFQERAKRRSAKQKQAIS